MAARRDACRALILFCALPLAAAENDWQRCRHIADPSTRLRCYDQLADTAITTPAITAPAAAATAVNSPTPVTPNPNQNPTAAVVPAQGVISEPTVARMQTEAEFGLEQVTRTQELDVIVSRILGEFRGWQPKARITLENGQVWQVSDGSEGVFRLQDPVVRIERGALGSFFLRIDGINKAPRVKRVK